MDLTRLQDLIRGTHIVQTYNFLKKSDFWNDLQLSDYQNAKLRKLVEYIYKNVPYYTDLFNESGLVPKDILSVKDLNKLPVLTKNVMRSNHEKFMPKSLNVNNRKIKFAKTGGTTGMPFTFYKNTATRDFTWGAYKRWYDWMGIKSDDKECVLWGASTVLKEKKTIKDFIIDKFGNTLTINSFKMSPEEMPTIAKRIMAFSPVILRGYLSAIMQVAMYFKERNLMLPSLKAISSTTETLLPSYRHFIENTFEVKMFDQYGCGECNSMAFECNHHKGLHINEEHCIVEVVDENGQPVYDRPGRVIVTDLDNTAFPFLRYENGDTAIMSSEKCSCGKASKLLKSISGRTKDVVWLNNGSPVHGVFFTDIFHEMGFDNFEYFTRFQIVQKVKGNFICRLEKRDKEIPSQILNQIHEVLQKFGNEVEVEILPRLQEDKSGKFRYIISEIDNNQQ